MPHFGTRAALSTGRRVVAVCLGALLLTPMAAPGAPAHEATENTSSVIVQAVPGERDGAAELVRSLGGHVDQHLDIINGFSARVPSSALESLAQSSSVKAVTPNGRVTLSSRAKRKPLCKRDHRRRPPHKHKHCRHKPRAEPEPEPPQHPGSGKGTSYDFTQAIGARKLWEQGYTGSGVDIALIDSGVVPVKGLRHAGKVVHGPDFSWESQAENLRYLDTYGHGTHMAGLITGREGASGAAYQSNQDHHFGVAPDSRLISLKVADAKGLTDVTQVIAAIDWIVAHRKDAGMNIRVISLSFGTDGTQTYLLDPLSFAVERAWKKGIVVVAAAGNTGFGDLSLNNPAFNPFVIAVGATDTRGTPSVSDDVVPNWSTTGNLLRNPDVVAPGTSIVSYRNRMSYIDKHHQEGRIGDRYFKGSGTSQATAIASGAVALLLDRRPNLKPDQVKKALTATATRLPGASSRAQGHGLLNLPAANNYSSFFLSGQLHLPGTGLGTLLGARGSNVISSSGLPLVGQKDIFGQPWLATTITNLGNSLLGIFNGTLLSGLGFVTDPVLGLVWATVGWERNDWTGSRWTDDSWTGSRWTGSRWTGSRWTGSRWTGSRWTGDNWSSVSWGN